MFPDHPIIQKIRHLLLEWRVFLIINAATPFVYVMFVKSVELQMRVQNAFAISLLLLIFFANLWCAINWKAQRRAFVVIIFLNLFALVMVGDVSFFTAIPTLIFIVRFFGSHLLF